MAASPGPPPSAVAGPSVLPVTVNPSSSQAPSGKMSYRSALGRSASAPYIPVSSLPRIPPIPLGPKPPSSDGSPVLFVSPSEYAMAAEVHKRTLLAKFSSDRPPVDLFEQHVNSSWGLAKPASVGLLDARHISIHLQSDEDFAVAWSRESHVFENRRFLLLRWTPAFSKKKDSKFAAVWLRFPGLPLPFQNPSILEAIGNILGNFLRLDQRTSCLKHPIAPRICVEMDLSTPPPDKIRIEVGTSEILWQRVEMDSSLGFCSFCHLQGHTAAICRKRTANPKGLAPVVRNPAQAGRKRGNNGKEVLQFEDLPNGEVQVQKNLSKPLIGSSVWQKKVISGEPSTVKETSIPKSMEARSEGPASSLLACDSSKEDSSPQLNGHQSAGLGHQSTGLGHQSTGTSLPGNIQQAPQLEANVQPVNGNPDPDVPCPVLLQQLTQHFSEENANADPLNEKTATDAPTNIIKGSEDGMEYQSMGNEAAAAILAPQDDDGFGGIKSSYLGDSPSEFFIIKSRPKDQQIRLDPFAPEFQLLSVDFHSKSGTAAMLQPATEAMKANEVLMDAVLTDPQKAPVQSPVNSQPQIQESRHTHSQVQLAPPTSQDCSGVSSPGRNVDSRPASQLQVHVSRLTGQVPQSRAHSTVNSSSILPLCRLNTNADLESDPPSSPGSPAVSPPKVTRKSKRKAGQAQVKNSSESATVSASTLVSNE